MLFIIRHFFINFHARRRYLHSFPTRRSSDLRGLACAEHHQPARACSHQRCLAVAFAYTGCSKQPWELHRAAARRSEEHTSELQSRGHLVCRLLLEKKKNITVMMLSYICTSSI